MSIQEMAAGFLYSTMELETAVRLKVNIVHMIWIDGTYDKVATQEKLTYGRTLEINFGPIDYIKYAEAFGATGPSLVMTTTRARSASARSRMVHPPNPSAASNAFASSP